MKKVSLTTIIALILSAFSAQAQAPLIPVEKAKENKEVFTTKKLTTFDS